MQYDSQAGRVLYRSQVRRHGVSGATTVDLLRFRADGQNGGRQLENERMVLLAPTFLPSSEAHFALAV